MSDDPKGETKSTRSRWWLTATIVSILLVASQTAIVLTFVVKGQTVPLWAAGTFTLSVLAAVGWTFGEKYLNAAAEAQG